MDSISSGLQESNISTRILSEIKIRTGAVSSERSFLAASCSDGSLAKTRSCEYSCAVTPQVRQTGNRLSGLAGTAYASLFT